MAKNYYDILGIEKGASKEDIKKAYKKLAKKYHPDISKEADAESKFKEINEAAGVLLDDSKRQHYDSYGTAEGMGSGFGGFGGGGFNPSDFGINLDDIFEQFGFGGFGGGGSRRSRQKRDSNIMQEIEITLEDVYFGTKKDVRIARKVECDLCDGKGAENDSDIDTCSTCGGSGVVIETQRSFLGAIRTQRTCPTCSGSGKIIKKACSKCSGSGYEMLRESVEVKVPKGIEDGVTLRVSGKGNYDPDTNSYGDLYLKVYVKRDSDYDVSGQDLYRNLDINFVSAIVGDEVEFEHFDKTLSVKIPVGTQPGTVLRLRDKGLPYFNSNDKGDLFVKVNVEIPKKTTKEQKRILLEYAKTLDDKGLLNRVKGLFK